MGKLQSIIVINNIKIHLWLQKEVLRRWSIFIRENRSDLWTAVLTSVFVTSVVSLIRNYRTCPTRSVSDFRGFNKWNDRVFIISVSKVLKRFGQGWCKCYTIILYLFCQTSRQFSTQHICDHALFYWHFQYTKDNQYNLIWTSENEKIDVYWPFSHMNSRSEFKFIWHLKSCRTFEVKSEKNTRSDLGHVKYWTLGLYSDRMTQD